jgi:hypothetical protein
MVNNSVVVPVAVLASICVAMFVFVWWWFPRHYRKGIAQDMTIVDGERGERDAAHAGLGGDERPKTLEEHIAIARANIRSGRTRPGDLP